MSAYLCNDSAFSTLGCFAALTIKGLDATSAATVLKSENIRSVNARYCKNSQSAPVDMSTAQATPSRADLLDIISEYDYQSCENSDYNETAAGRLINKLRSNAIAYVPNDNTAFLDGALLGRAVYRESTGRRGYIVGVSESDCDTYSIDFGAGGMKKDSNVLLTVVWLPGYECKTLARSIDNLNHLESEMSSSYNYPAITPAQCEVLERDYQKQANEERKARSAEVERVEVERAAFEADIKKVIPAGCRGVIVANLLNDESDPMSDYFASSTKSAVILGFSSNNRNSFPEMRKAILSANLSDYPDILELADKEQSDENRENWSMGKGFYLSKKGHSTYSGWQVKKIRAYGKSLIDVKDIPVGEILTQKQQEAAAGVLNSAVKVIENTEKNGIELVFNEKPARALIDRIKGAGYRWHRKGVYWYANKTAAALEIADQLKNGGRVSV
jgi:hypothetical protein